MKQQSWLQTGVNNLVVRQFAGSSSHKALDKPIVVAHLTDQHFGPATPHALQVEAVRRVNEANPDLVVLTGDYVAYSLDHLDEAQEVLSGINARTIGTLGNHDHWTDPKEVTRVLERSGVEVLSNAWTDLRVRNQHIQIVGVDDAFTAHADSEAATRGLQKNVPTLGLSHVGEEADHLWRYGVPLVLSGHTHSGQFAIAQSHRLLMGYLAGHRYVHGLYGERGFDNEGALYVNAGIGSSRFGLRIGKRAQPEVAFFHLGATPQCIEEPEAPKRALHKRMTSKRTQLKRRRQALEKQRAYKKL